MRAAVRAAGRGGKGGGAARVFVPRPGESTRPTAQGHVSGTGRAAPDLLTDTLIDLLTDLLMD